MITIAIPPGEIEVGDDVYMAKVGEWRFNVDMISKRGEKLYVRFKGDYYFVRLTEEKYIVLRPE